MGHFLRRTAVGTTWPQNGTFLELNTSSETENRISTAIRSNRLIVVAQIIRSTFAQSEVAVVTCLCEENESIDNYLSDI